MKFNTKRFTDSTCTLGTLLCDLLFLRIAQARSAIDH